MTREVTFGQCVAVYEKHIGAGALMNREALESALAQPFAGFGEQEHYPTLYEKAARLGFGICQAHAFQDGNKRLAWIMTVAFLTMNGTSVDVDEDEAAHVVLAVAAGSCSYEEFVAWLTACVLPSALSEEAASSAG